MSERRLIRFLERRGAGELGHGGRSLLEHLRGTYAVLLAWGAAPAVCRAGLFHSVYGTSVYKRRALALRERARVTELIGAEAEQLAYLFCIADRPRAWDVPLADAALLTVGGGRLPLSRRRFGRLLEIECANLAEQPDGAAYLPAVARHVLRQPGLVSAGCRRAMAA